MRWGRTAQSGSAPFPPSPSSSARLSFAATAAAVSPGQAMAATQIAEPFDLIRVSLSERVFVKLRGDRELRGLLHVRPLFSLSAPIQR